VPARLSRIQLSRRVILARDTAELFKTACADAYARFKPDAMIVGASCTAELIQDDPGGLAKALPIANSRCPA